MRTTYIEYDEKGNVKSKCITEYDDSDFLNECDGACRPAEEESDIRLELSPRSCAAVALYEAGLIDDIDEPAVDEFWNKFVELIVMCFDDDGVLRS